MDNKRHYRQCEKLKKFKVYYFTGDHWSSKGKIMKSSVIRAESEEDAENIFCRTYGISSGNIGFIEEVS